VVSLIAMVVGLMTARPVIAATPGETPEKAARRLVQRFVGNRADQFVFEAIPQEDSRDVFELESRDGKMVVRGSTGVAMASGWNWYLKHYCHCHVSLWGNNLALPNPLPVVPEKVRQVSPFKYRYYLNFCAFSYSLPWYDWAQWERLIDWMALEGINMPLSVTGQEAIWRKVYRDLGLTDKQLEGFFVGPAYLPFGWMGCIDAWGGPLPQSWIDQRLELQKKIVARQRELGMTPVLQGFTGHVPSALKEKLPAAKLHALPSWCGFSPTHFLDPQDPLFVEIGKRFVEEQTREFGADHLYASDTFIEMPPPSNDPPFLAAMGKGVYEAMRAGDPKAVWVMQGWPFYFNAQFWQAPQAKALFGAVPDDRMILLDLYCEKSPVWSKTEAFHGKPWLYCLIQDFGGVVSLHGGMPQIAGGLQAARTSPKRGQLVGIGFVNEALGYNPAVNALMGEMVWRAEAPELKTWVRGFALSRYGRLPPAAEEAWNTLQTTVYSTPSRADSVVCNRPAFSGRPRWADVGAPYDKIRTAQAWHKLLSCADELGSVDAYRFDLVHLGRHVLDSLAASRLQEVADAYQQKDREAFAEATARYVELLRDMDKLLGTREEFLLGRWLADAKRWATNDDERKLYEWNARNLITLWGPRGNMLYEYSQRQWSGLFTGYYLPRWEMFFQRLDASLTEGKPFDAGAFEQAVCDWEVQWTHAQETYPSTPQGDSVAASRNLWEKYASNFAPNAASLTTGKLVACSAAQPENPANLAKRR
jgi:alpha-N-acetylglucosaminidase